MKDMTEQEFLVCDDPGKMLMRWSVGSPRRHYTATDAQLRLWVEACRDQSGQKDRPWGNYDLDFPNSLQVAVSRWSRCDQSVMPVDPLPVRAAILRDIVGNPFQLSFMWVNEVPPVSTLRNTRTWLLRSWLTPTVLALARAAHEERVTRKCERCRGTGVVGKQLTRIVRDVDAHCPDCKGTGTFPTAELDRDCLLILADALEEAGCDDVPCPPCEKVGLGHTMPNPILAHLRGPGPHWRGCHVLQALLGEEPT